MEPQVLNILRANQALVNNIRALLIQIEQTTCQLLGNVQTGDLDLARNILSTLLELHTHKPMTLENQVHRANKVFGTLQALQTRFSLQKLPLDKMQDLAEAQFPIDPGTVDHYYFSVMLWMLHVPIPNPEGLNSANVLWPQKACQDHLQIPTVSKDWKRICPLKAWSLFGVQSSYYWPLRVIWTILKKHFLKKLDLPHCNLALLQHDLQLPE